MTTSRNSDKYQYAVLKNPEALKRIVILALERFPASVEFQFAQDINSFLQEHQGRISELNQRPRMILAEKSKEYGLNLTPDQVKKYSSFGWFFKKNFDQLLKLLPEADQQEIRSIPQFLEISRCVLALEDIGDFWF